MARCGLLPGPLGTGKDNCIQRCRSTDEDDLAVLAGCDEVAPSDPAQSECLERVEEELGCEAYATCLRDEYRDDAIVGLATTDLQLFGAEMSGLPTEYACEAGSPTELDCISDPYSSPDCEDNVIRSRADAWCQSTGTVEIEYFVMQDGTQRSVSGPCGELARGATIDDSGLFPGASVEVMASFRSAPLGTSNLRCASSHGTRLLLRAGRNPLLVPVPSLFLGTPGAWLGSCEHGDACTDGVDNDLDGFVDCLDSECIPDCAMDESQG